MKNKKVNAQKKKYWLRGGIIGLLIYIISLCLYELAHFSDLFAIGVGLFILFTLMSYPLLSLLNIDNLFFNTATFIPEMKFAGHILTLLLLIIIGALIGLLIGKIKNREKSK